MKLILFLSLVLGFTAAAQTSLEVKPPTEAVSVETVKKPYSKILLITEIDPFHFAWPEISLDEAKSFMTPINDSWVKWFNENLPDSVSSVILCKDDCTSYYSQWMDTNADELAEKITDDYRDAVWLKINIQLDRVSKIDSLQEDTFEWKGRMVLQELNTKNTLSILELPTERRRLKQGDQKNMNSQLASSIYRSGTLIFQQVGKKLPTTKAMNRTAKLMIIGQKNLGDAMALIEKLKTRGISLGLNIKLDSFSAGQANVSCFYHGEEKSFIDLLSDLKELKSTNSYNVVVESNGTQLTIKLVAH